MQTSSTVRMTRQREAILQALREGGGHPTADEIHERVRVSLPHISLGTVYRNLALLSQAGLIRHLELGGEPSRFDGDLHPHYHVRCRRCGRVADAPMGTRHDLDDAAREVSDYEVFSHRLEFIGLCPNCREGVC
jgi:Fur family ferric uptake transcriptional regulator